MFREYKGVDCGCVYYAGCREQHHITRDVVLEICCIQSALKSRVLHKFKSDVITELIEIWIDECDLEYCVILSDLFEHVNCNHIYYTGHIIEVIKHAAREWCHMYEVIMKKWIRREFNDSPRAYRGILFVKMFIDYPPFRECIKKSGWLCKCYKKAYPDEWISEVYADLCSL